MDITKLEHKNKSLFAIKLAEKASSYLQESNARSLINKAIEVCWKWIHTEEKVGEVLYYLSNCLMPLSADYSAVILLTDTVPFITIRRRRDSWGFG